MVSDNHMWIWSDRTIQSREKKHDLSLKKLEIFFTLIDNLIDLYALNQNFIHTIKWTIIGARMCFDPAYAESIDVTWDSFVCVK